MQRLRNLLVIGGGNMGGAVARAAYAGRPRVQDVVAVVEPDEARRAAMDREFSGGVRLFAAAADAVREIGGSAGIVLAVKPQVFPQLAGELRDAKVLRSHLIISVMAGVRAEGVYQALGGGRGFGSHIRVVRAMPSLTMAYAEGVTAICPGPAANPDDLKAATDLFEMGGSVVRIDESLFDAFTALSASGLAYVFYLAEAMERAAAEVGFDAAQAREIVRRTIAGASEMQREHRDENDALSFRELSPAQMRARVTSKGGTTEAATRVLDEAGVQDAVVRAIVAGRDRGREISDLVSGG